MPNISNAKSGKGTTFTYNSYVISNINKVGGVEVGADAQEVSIQSSPGKEYIGGMIDGGEVVVEGYFYPGDTNGQVALFNAVGGTDPVACLITFPAAFAAVWSFEALVTAFSTGDVELEGGLPFTATLKISGVPTLTITATTGLTTTFFTISESAVIVPAPASAVYDYVATVATGITSVTITPTATGGQTIKVDGNTVGTGVPSSAITLGAAGSITTSTIVVSYAGKVSKTYNIRIVRATS